jgi:radical SAM/Cys-rich protein
MAGVCRSLGVVAIRIKSDVLTWPDDGRTQDKYCVEPGTYSGIVLLYSTHTGEPLALMNDGVVQHMRVGGCAGLGTDVLARPDAEVLGLVDIIASLPCYTAENVDKQRGRGVFGRSMDALRLLNAAGYGKTDSALRLDLVFNPGGASLPPRQDVLERAYKQHLRDEFGIEFGRLLTITNMPIRRFSDYLVRIGQQQSYHSLLKNSFNPDTVQGVMCRSLISVSWDGWLYDCDFNQMLELPVARRSSIWDIECFSQVAQDEIQVGDHCFGCTAGTGSSCGGQLT